jgi:hypothetical protein
MEKPNGKRPAKGQSRDPKTEIRKAENTSRAGFPVPDEIGDGRRNETTRQETAVAIAMQLWIMRPTHA